MSRFIPASGREDEESYVTNPVDSIPRFTVKARATTNKRWSKIAKKKGLKPNAQEYESLFDTSEESCKEALVEWSGTQHVWPQDGPEGLPVTDENMAKMAWRLCASQNEITNPDGTKGWQSFWVSMQEQIIEQRAVEAKN